MTRNGPYHTINNLLNCRHWFPLQLTEIGYSNRKLIKIKTKEQRKNCLLIRSNLLIVWFHDRCPTKRTTKPCNTFFYSFSVNWSVNNHHHFSFQHNQNTNLMAETGFDTNGSLNRPVDYEIFAYLESFGQFCISLYI